MVNSSLLVLILAVPYGSYFVSLIDDTYLRLFIGALVIVSIYIIWRGIGNNWRRSNLGTAKPLG